MGAVTIICGKNDSGKTRLLTALATQNQKKVLEHVTPTANLDEDFLVAVIDKINSLRSERSLAPYTPEQSRAIRELLSSSLSTKSIWRRDEMSEMTAQVKQAIDSDRSLWEESLMGDVASALDKEMPQVLTPNDMILIPPKRKLQPTETSQNSKVVAQGTGIVSALFSAKNQDPDHDDYKRFEVFRDAFTRITGGYQVNVTMRTNNSVDLKISEDGSSWKPANQVGLGFGDLVAILYFAIYSKYSLVLIEEPENHLHPEMQRRLLEFLASQEDKQFIITTHSNIFLDNRFASKMFLTQKIDGQIQVSDITSKALALNELGYDVADNVVSDLIILCEGPSDVPIIKEFLRKKGLTEKHSIKLWPLGGDIMGKKEVDLEVFLQSYKIMALVDNDPGSESVRRKFSENCEHLGIDVARLEKYAIENYFTLEALRKEYGDQIPSDVTEIDSKKKLEEQIGFNVKKKNFNIARAMSLEDVKGTDFEEFLDRVEQLLQQEQLEEKVDA